MVIAEGVKNQSGERQKAIGDYLAQQINQVSQRLCLTGKPEFCDLNKIETRATVLGHNNFLVQTARSLGIYLGI